MKPFLLRLLTIVAVIAAMAVPASAQTPRQRLAAEGPPPPGANDPDCRPSPAHPVPVVLVPGTFETMAKNWPTLSPVLRNAGYCVYSLNYGESGPARIPATGPIEDSARELGDFVRLVRVITGAPKVSLVGHSQGGMMPRYYLKFLGGDQYVTELVGLVPSNHGTTLGDGGSNPNCRACEQQQQGSAFLRNLNRGDETPGVGLNYTVITTVNDEVVVPYTSAFLRDDGKRVTNITVQDDCPGDQIEHDQIPNDPVAHQYVLNALGRTGPASPAFTPICA